MSLAGESQGYQEYMKMDFIDLYQRSYQRVNMPTFNSQPQPTPHGPQLALWTNQQLMALYQQQRNAVMMAQGGLHGSKQTEPQAEADEGRGGLLGRGIREESEAD